MTLTGGFAALPSFSHLASAQTYPTRPVRIVGYGLGGVADILTRLLSEALSGRLGQPFILETGRARQLIWLLKRSLVRRQTATHFFW